MTRGRSGGGAVVAVLVTLLVCAVVGLAGYGYLHFRHSQERADTVARAEAQVTETRQQAQALGVDLAQDIARTLGATMADDVGRVEHAMVESELAAIVRGKRVVGVVVLSTKGDVIATTDQRYAVTSASDPDTKRALDASTLTLEPDTPVPGQVEVVAPLYVGSDRVGTARVFVNLAPFAPPPPAAKE
jgi:hypothetical protein